MTHPPIDQESTKEKRGTTAAEVIRVEIDGLVNPTALHFGPEVGDLPLVARNWRETGAHVERFVPESAPNVLSPEEARDISELVAGQPSAEQEQRALAVLRRLATYAKEQS